MVNALYLQHQYRKVPKVAAPRKKRLSESNVNFWTSLAIPESSGPPESDSYPKVKSIFGLSFFDPLWHNMYYQPSVLKIKQAIVIS